MNTFSLKIKLYNKTTKNTFFPIFTEINISLKILILIVYFGQL